MSVMPPPVPIDPRPLSALESALVERLLQDPFAPPELRAQLDSVRVNAQCGCGCASVKLEVAPDAPVAVFDAGDVPSGRTDWFHLTATGTDAAGEWVEVILHVSGGVLYELEIWSGEEGQVVTPVVASLQLDERTSARLCQAVARALIERLEPQLPEGVELRPTWPGGIDVHRAGAEDASVSGHGDLATTAQTMLWSVGYALDEYTEGSWLSCPHPVEECACGDTGAVLEGDALRVWFGEAERPTRTFAPITRSELDRLATLWQPE